VMLSEMLQLVVTLIMGMAGIVGGAVIIAGRGILWVFPTRNTLNMIFDTICKVAEIIYETALPLCDMSTTMGQGAAIVLAIASLALFSFGCLWADDYRARTGKNDFFELAFAVVTSYGILVFFALGAVEKCCFMASNIASGQAMTSVVKAVAEISTHAYGMLRPIFSYGAAEARALVAFVGEASSDFVSDVSFGLRTAGMKGLTHSITSGFMAGFMSSKAGYTTVVVVGTLLTLLVVYGCHHMLSRLARNHTRRAGTPPRVQPPASVANDVAAAAAALQQRQQGQEWLRRRELALDTNTPLTPGGHRPLQPSSHAAEEVPSQYLCPISMELMVDPVLTSTGQCYERDNIQKWFAINAVDPLTGTRLHSKMLVPNHPLRQLIEAWKANRRADETGETRGDEGVAEEWEKEVEEMAPVSASALRMLQGLTPADLRGGS